MPSVPLPSLAELLEEKRQHETKRCSLGKYLDEFESDELSALEYLLLRCKEEEEAGLKNHERTYSRSVVANMLKKAGYSMTKETVGKHLTGRCACRS